MKRSITATFAFLALAACAPVTPNVQASASGIVPRFEAGACLFEASRIPRKVDCGTLYVAEDRAKPGGNQVAIPVAIVRASDPNSKPDPVVFLHGGPGGDVVAGLPGWFDSRRLQTVTTDRDWIFFDQRGTGSGLPDLDCGTVQLTDSGLASDADVVAMTACYERLKGQGIDLSKYNSEQIAADVADMRGVLGFDQYNLVGISYGSRVAFSVMQYASEGLRAVVHDAPYPPESKGTENLPVLVAREVRQVLALCEADPACKIRYGGLEPRLTAMAAQWARNPATVQGKTYTVEDLASWLLDATYGWASTRSLPRDIDAVMNGRMGVLDDYIANRSVYEEAQNMATFCKEELPFESVAEMTRKAGTDPLALAIVSTTSRYFEACKAWDLGPPNPREIEPVVSSIPTLVIASEIDAGCPTDAAAATMVNLSKGTFIPVPNATHGISRRSVCVNGIVTRFLDNPAAPVDQSCVAIEHARLPFILD